MNKMMFKMMADFLGIEPDEIREMVFSGNQAIKDGLALVVTFDERMRAIENVLGLRAQSDVIIDQPIKELENGETPSKPARNRNGSSRSAQSASAD